MRSRHILLTVLLPSLVIALAGCAKRRPVDRPGDGEDADIAGEWPKLSDVEVERRLNSYFLDLDSAANFEELFAMISEGLAVEIKVETDRISRKKPVELKNSKESLVIQILEVVTDSTRTRFEVRKGKIWIKDAR